MTKLTCYTVIFRKFQDPAELRKHKEQVEMDLAMEKGTLIQVIYIRMVMLYN